MGAGNAGNWIYCGLLLSTVHAAKVASLASKGFTKDLKQDLKSLEGLVVSGLRGSSNAWPSNGTNVTASDWESPTLKKGRQGAALNPSASNASDASEPNASNELPVPGHRKEIFEEPRKVMGVALNGDSDVQTLHTSLVVGGLGSAGVFLVFAILHVAVPQVYHRRKTTSKPEDDPDYAEHMHLEVSSGFRWVDFIWKVWNSTPEDEVRLAGLDGWSLLEFVRLNLRIMTIVGPFLLAVVLPLHFFFNTKESHNNLDWLSCLDIGNLPRDDWMLWFHAAVVWFVVLISAWQISLAHEGFTERRYQWLSTVPRPRSTTVMVRNIPPMYRSDSALKEYFDRVFSEESAHTVERAYVIRKTGRLPKLVKQLESSQYDAHVASSRLNKARESEKASLESDLQRCQLTVTNLKSRVAKEQQAVELALQGPRPDWKVASSSGFVTFTTILSQRLASREQCTRDVSAFRMYMAPDPHDVLYENLAEDDINASSWRWLGRLALLAVFLFWIPIVVAISGWTTLSSIQGTVPAVKKFVEAHPTIGSLMSGVLATAALKIFMMFLPTVLHFIITTTLHLKAGSVEQLKLQQWSAAFLLLFVVLVTSLGRGLTITFFIVMQEPAKIISLLAASLPSASHFYFNYVILGWLVLPMEYSFLQLDNGLKAIIGSDPKCDKAGAGLCVNVGMCHERKDLPGLAHFLEHMLFTGTAKYPKEGEYHEFMQQNGGESNAYTACYFTCYMFEVKPEVLVEALDRFARFFTEPSLTRDCTEREINAVDSEYQAGLTSPWWRYVGILNMSANPDHPFHVAVGNNKVLLEDPKERGIDLYDEMKKFYESTYSANGMTLCVFGREPTAQMEEILREKFGAVVNKGINMPIGDSVCDAPPFAKWHQLLLQNPVQDVKDLTFSWVIPFQAPFWRTKPSEYISHLLGHEGKGSIIAALKEQGLISACSAGNGAWLEGAFSLLNVTFELTDKGLDAVNDIGRYLFAYLGMLQKSAPEKRIFEEAQRLAAIRFKFKEDASPFNLCPDIALNLQRLPFDPEAISSLLSKLTLDTVRVQFQAKILAERCTQKDTSYDSPMELLPIDPAWLECWAGALRATGTLEESKDIATKMGLHLPPPNPFIPEDLSLKPAPADNPVVPQLLSVESGVSIFHRQDDLFKQPKAQVTFYIYSPYFHQDVSSYLKTALWSQCVEEALQDYAYDAQIAGMGYTIQLSGGCLKMALSGFNDKLHVLLEAVTDKMVSMTSVPEHIFGIILDTFGDDLRNQAYHSQPISQAQMRFQDLLNRGSSFPALELLETLPKVQRSDLDNLCQSLFVDGAHVEVLSLGNLTNNDAKQLSNKLVTGLKLTKPLKSLPYRAEAAFPTGSTLWELDSADVDDPNHAVMMKLQLPEGLEDEMHVMLLDKLLGAKFFEILRTQQQLGYIVQMGATVPLKLPQLVALAQTEFPPDYVRGCIGKFMSEHFEFIQKTLTEDEFQVCKDGLLSQLRMKPKNLREEARRYTRQMNDRSFDFGWRERGACFVEKLTLESFKSYVAETVMKAPQIYVQVKKVFEKEDKALPSGATADFPDPDGLRRWSGATTVKDFGDSARWYPVNASVAPAKL